MAGNTIPENNDDDNILTSKDLQDIQKGMDDIDAGRFCNSEWIARKHGTGKEKLSEMCTVVFDSKEDRERTIESLNQYSPAVPFKSIDLKTIMVQKCDSDLLKDMSSDFRLQ